MKISLIGPVYPYRGGIAHYTASLAKALVAAGHDVQVVSYRRQYPAALYPGQSDKDPSLHPIRVEAQFLLDPLYPWTWVETAKCIARSHPDLVLLQWWTTFWAPAYSVLARSLRSRSPVVYLIHNVFPHETKPWDRAMARLALSQGTAYIVQAPHERKKLEQLLPRAMISYCNHPVYGRFGQEPISKQLARGQLGLPPDRPLVLFFGIVRPYKGLKYLMEALAQAKTDAQLVVAGEFWEDVTYYRELIKHLGLAGQVTLIDKYIPNEEAHILFSAADLLVAPYVDGTQSGAVELALGYGLPSIVTEPIMAAIDQSKIGSLQVVPAGNSRALAEALTNAIASLPGWAASQHPAEDDWWRMVEAIEEIGRATVVPVGEPGSK